MQLAGVAVDAVMDSVSVKTTFKETLSEKGIIFCSISEAIRDYPDLIKIPGQRGALHRQLLCGAQRGGLLRRIVLLHSQRGALSDGAVDLLPHQRRGYGTVRTHAHRRRRRGLRELSGRVYRPRRDENQLHAAVVEIVVERDAEVKYSTVQNWYPGDKEGRGGIYNFVTKRGLCRQNARLSWTQVETGSAITWKYPSCVLLGDNSVGEFYSVAMTNHFQQADTGTKMIHIGRNTRSRIVSKGISAGRSENSYRGLVKVARSAEGGAQLFAVRLAADRLRMRGAYLSRDCVQQPHGDRRARGHDFEDLRRTAFYCNQRGLSTEDAVGLIVNGFAKEVMAKLPMEFAVEAQKLLSISLEGSVG